MMSSTERLAYMTNQIARNFAAIGHDRAAAATADHISSFWDPRMRAQILEIAREGVPALGPVAGAAVEILRSKGAPASQTSATRFADVAGTGHDDAG